MQIRATSFFLLCLTVGIADVILLRSTTFHYPRVIADEPFHHPLKVTSFHNNCLNLEDGRAIELDMDIPDLAAKLADSGFQIDVEGDASPIIFSRQKSWICGTPWAKPIQIPLIPDTVYKNPRRILSLGSWRTPPASPTTIPEHR